MNLVEALISGQLDKARTLFAEKMGEKCYSIVEEYRKVVAEGYVNSDDDDDGIDEVLLEGKPRIRIIQARIRNGKIQRRKKVSQAAGYKMAGGRLKRMSPVERRRRKLGQRMGKIKRRGKMVLALKRRKRSLQRRKAFGG